jgi:hypothetical protein
MKGLELPMSTIIVIILVLIVLLGVVAIWISGFGGGATTISVEAAKSAGCGKLMRDVRGCTAVDPATILFDGTAIGVPKYDVNGDGHYCPADAVACAGPPALQDDSLQYLCVKYYGTTLIDQVGCRKVCGCGG